MALEFNSSSIGTIGIKPADPIEGTTGTYGKITGLLIAEFSLFFLQELKKHSSPFLTIERSPDFECLTRWEVLCNQFFVRRLADFFPKRLHQLHFLPAVEGLYCIQNFGK